MSPKGSGKKREIAQPFFHWAIRLDIRENKETDKWLAQWLSDFRKQQHLRDNYKHYRGFVPAYSKENKGKMLLHGYELNYTPPNSYVEALNPVTQNVIIFGDKIFERGLS